MNMPRDWSWAFIGSLVQPLHPAGLSLALVGLGGWFMGMRSLVSNIVTEDYVVYAELGGVERRRILASYVMRNALVPQVTGLAMSLGAIFNGAIITEQVFGYPGVGTLLVSAVYAGDYSLVLGITTVSIVAVSLAVLLIDLSLSAARSPRRARCDGAPSCDLLRYNRQFASGVVLLAVVAGFSCLSFFSPYPPNDSFVVPPDLPPSWAHPFGTTSRGQDLFWLLTLRHPQHAAVRHRRRRPEPHAGARDRPRRRLQGRLVDRALMSINDTFIVIPLFPILVLFYFVMREHMSWGLLALMMALPGLGLRRAADPLGGDEPAHPRIHRDRHLLRHEHAPDPGRGAPALRAADRVLDHHEQHQLVDRPRSDAVGAGLHRHQHADHRRA